MASILTGITHAIVTVPSRADSQASGVRASVALCYGPGDDNAITNINLLHSSGGSSWNVPHIQEIRDGKWIWVPVFRGEVLEQVSDTAARALERVKEQIGKPQWNTSYRVFGTPDGTSKVEIVE